MVVYANIDDLLEELSDVLRENKQSFYRIGTGELADSLALDPLTESSRPLVEFFAQQSNAVLEFKTKSDCVEHLLELPHEGRTVVSWSMNTRHIQSQEEHKTATIDERLMAAERCIAAGYRVAFHFDPLVYYLGWECDYEDLIREVLVRFPSSSLAWVSVGALRMTSDLRRTILRRFPGSTLPTGELVPCPDGKLRYTKSIRRAMYERVFGWIRQYGPSDLRVYACMERPEVWSRIFGSAPLTDIEIGDSITASFQ
jgi:spore photoproduct lyase